jgi:hypothetical protein
MSDSNASFSFPHRTPVFTTGLVLVCFALFGWLAIKVYTPKAYQVDKVEGVRSPADRTQILADLRAKEHTNATTYGYVDQKAGIVRLPIDRAMALTAQERGSK